MRSGISRYAWTLGFVSMLSVPAPADSFFAVEVVEFDPAPGQFVNVSEFNDPTAALGAPVGGGTVNPDNSKLVSIGGFGGTLTLRFDHVVRNDPSNPFGLDAIVFGNATWVGGNNNRHWAECAVIEISRDVNGNHEPDDPWYLIPGSHITSPATQWACQTWDDDVEDPTYPPTPPDGIPNDDWIPPGRSGVWTTCGYRLPSAIFDTAILVNPNGTGATEEGVWGYADNSPTLVLGDLDGDGSVDDPEIPPSKFYVVPDDPLMVGITPGSAGGDAFDIAWAIDPATGAPAGLDGFDFIRITNGVNYVQSIFGEVSAEIGGVADVLPGRGDINCDGVVNLFDVDPFSLALTDPDEYEQRYPECSLRNADINGDGDVDLFDIDPFVILLSGKCSEDQSKR